ncbi:MAG: hypothetical protein MK212_08640 [Saprospiraceae bacterium]|nr:hypothetical protein [Saprospiraceae bacterium]
MVESIKKKDSQILSKMVYDYDEQGNITTKVEYSGLEVKRIYTYTYEYFN